MGGSPASEIEATSFHEVGNEPIVKCDSVTMACCGPMSTAIENHILEFSIIVPLPGQDVTWMG